MILDGPDDGGLNFKKSYIKFCLDFLDRHTNCKVPLHLTTLRQCLLYCKRTKLAHS